MTGEDCSTQWHPHDQQFMRAALQEARRALQQQETPVGCVIVRDGEVVATGSNRTNETRNGTRHAEIEAVDSVLARCNGDTSQAAFDSCDLYVTCEPCIMCAGALSLLGFRSIVYGCSNDRFGGCGSILDINTRGCGSCGIGEGAAGIKGVMHGRGFSCKGGLFAEEAVELLRDFYTAGNPRAPKPKRPLKSPGGT